MPWHRLRRRPLGRRRLGRHERQAARRRLQRRALRGRRGRRRRLALGELGDHAGQARADGLAQLFGKGLDGCMDAFGGRQGPFAREQSVLC